MIFLIQFEDHLGRSLTGMRPSVRMKAASQNDVELWADDTLNAWLRRNPGQPGSWTISAWVQPARLRDVG